MKINPFMFRGYDLRGVVGEDLNPQIVECLGKAFGTYLKRHNVKKAVIGRDCRKTSKEYGDYLIKGLNWSGIDTIDIGMNLVGTFYWSQYYLNCKGGAFITASHNPCQFNGFKFAIDFSETLVSEGIQELRRMVENDDFEKGEVPGRAEEQDIREKYFFELIKKFPDIEKLKVVVDPSNSTAGEIIPVLLKKIGCDVVENNCKIDPSFPLGTPDPTEKIVADRLSESVIREKADVGFSYDADGDRIGIVDNNGRIIWNDVLVAIFAMSVLKNHPGAIIMYNTLCSKVVEETIVKYGGKPFMWRTGHSFLKKKNQEVGAAFIGELSGHFFFSADFYNHDDGAYSTLYLLDYLTKSGKSFSEIIDSLPKYISSPEIKIFCADDKKVLLVNKIVDILKEDFKEAKIIDDERAGDGVRMDRKDCMFVIRYSQNGPYITIKFEAKEVSEYEKLKMYINDLLHRFSEIDWASKINVNIDSLKT